MSGLAGMRCVVPKFAQFVMRPMALTTTCINRKPNILLGARRFTTSVSTRAKETVSIQFVCDDGTKYTTNAKVGDNLLDVVIENDIDLDGFGACEGTLACSTCHLILEQSDYDKLPQEPTDEELDMLDLAYGLTDTSRLGCQIIVSKDMDGLVVRVPDGVADAREP
ncbi:Adrenodoxin [Mactra antiquata]